ncbi:hypothetical protein W97_04588 [Neofusicoccum parvum]|nr:hypothetical protein W97_04588 [Neofusicoccum parvum]
MSTLRPIHRILRATPPPRPLHPPPPRPALHSPSSSAARTPILNTPATSNPSLTPRLARLTTHTPWRLTAARTGLERGYEFGSAAAAARFGAGVCALADGARHHPEWAGCGRRVYVRWTTHAPAGLGEGDVGGAEACERLAGREGAEAPPGRDGGYSAAWVGRGGGVEWVREKRFKVVAARMMERVVGVGEGEDVFGEGVEEKEGVAVWGNVYNWGCVGRVRWMVVEGEDGRVERVEPYTGSGDVERGLGDRTKELRPDDHLAKKMEGLMQEVTSGWYRHTPEAEVEGRAIEELRRTKKEAEKNDTGR